jgi:hypothetical protein
LKFKFSWTKKELLDNKEFEKPSVARRREITRAKHVQKIKDSQKEN